MIVDSTVMSAMSAVSAVSDIVYDVVSISYGYLQVAIVIQNLDLCFPDSNIPSVTNPFSQRGIFEVAAGGTSRAIAISYGTMYV